MKLNRLILPVALAAALGLFAATSANAQHRGWGGYHNGQQIDQNNNQSSQGYGHMRGNRGGHMGGGHMRGGRGGCGYMGYGADNQNRNNHPGAFLTPIEMDDYHNKMRNMTTVKECKSINDAQQKLVKERAKAMSIDAPQFFDICSDMEKNGWFNKQEAKQ